MVEPKRCCCFSVRRVPNSVLSLLHCANERHIKDHTRSTPIGVDKAYSSPAKTKGGRRQRWEAGAIPVQMLSDNEVAWRSPGTDAPLGSRSEALQWLAGAREGFALTPGR